MNMSTEETLQLDPSTITVTMASSPICPTLLELRGYQKRVVEEALKHNTLAVLPTGSGKTLIATQVIQERLGILRAERLGNPAIPKKLIAFLAPTKILVGQQLKYIADHSDGVVIDFTGETSTIEGKSINYWNKHGWNNVFQDTEVIVMTPQIMKQMLQRKFFRPETFDLVVIDECHHALGFNPLTYICQTIKDSQTQPLILAITASPLTSRKGSIASQISQLEENLHCKLMCNEEILEEYRKIQPVASLGIFEFEPDSRQSLEKLVTSPETLAKSLKDFLSFRKPILLERSPTMLMLYAYLRVRHTAMIANVYNFIMSMGIVMDEIPEFKAARFPTEDLYKVYRRKGEFHEEYASMLGSSRRPMLHVMRSTVATKSTSNCVELTQSLAQILRITEECGVLSGLYAFMQCIKVKKSGYHHSGTNAGDADGNGGTNRPLLNPFVASRSKKSTKRVEFTNMFDLDKFDVMASELVQSPFNAVDLFHDEYMTSVSIIDFFVAFAAALGPRVCKLAAHAYLRKHSRPEISRSTCSVVLNHFESSSAAPCRSTCVVPKIHAVFYCLLQCVVKGGSQIHLTSEGSLVLLEAAWKEHVMEEETVQMEEDEEEGVIPPFCMSTFYLREVECRSAARSAAWFLLSSIPLENLRDWSKLDGNNCVSSHIAPFNLLAEDMKAAANASNHGKCSQDIWLPVWYTQHINFPIISNKVKALSKIWSILAEEAPTAHDADSMSEALESVMTSPRSYIGGDWSPREPVKLGEHDEAVENTENPSIELLVKDQPGDSSEKDTLQEENAFIVFCRVRLVAMSIHFVLSMVIANVFDNEQAPIDDEVELCPFDAHRFEVKNVLEGLIDNVVCREEGIEKMIAKTELITPPAFRPMHIVGRCHQSLQLKTLQHFKAGNYNIVFATDVMEEGLDVRSCKYVINFDLPGTLKSFIQRRGRSRADNSLMISMIPFGEDGSRLIEDLSYLIRQEMEVEAHTKTKKKATSELQLPEKYAAAPAELSCLESSFTMEVDYFEILQETRKILDFQGGSELLDDFLCGSTTVTIATQYESEEEYDPDLAAIAADAAKTGTSAFCMRQHQHGEDGDSDDGYEGMDDDTSSEMSEEENVSADELGAKRKLRDEQMIMFKKKSDHYLPGASPPRPKRRRFSPKLVSPSESPAPLDNLEYAPLNPRFSPSLMNVVQSPVKDIFQIDGQGTRPKRPNYSRYVVASTGAEVDVRSSSQILQRFCNQLPHDTFFLPMPIFWMERVPSSSNRRNDDAFQCSILLPPYVSPKMRFVTGPIASSKSSAKSLAALECVKLLHQFGELNDWLLITGSRETEKMGSKTFEQDQAEYRRAKKKKLSTVLSDDIMAEIHQKDYLRNTKDLVDQNGDPIEVDSIGIDVKVTPDLITLSSEKPMHNADGNNSGVIKLQDTPSEANKIKEEDGSILYFYVVQAEYGDSRSEEVLHKCPSCKLFFAGGNSFGICFSRRLPADLIEESFRCFIREREAIDVTVDFLESRCVSDHELLHMQRFHRGMYCWEVDAVTKHIGETWFGSRDCWIDPHYEMTKNHSDLINSCQPITHDEWRASGNGAWYVLFPLPMSLPDKSLFCTACASSNIGVSGSTYVPPPSKAKQIVNEMLNNANSLYRNHEQWLEYLVKTADEAQILANNLKRQEVINYEYAADYTFEPDEIDSHDRFYGMVLSRGSGGVYVVLDPYTPYDEPNPSYDADGNAIFIKKLNDVSKYVEKFETVDDIIRRKVSSVLQQMVDTIWVDASSKAGEVSAIQPTDHEIMDDDHMLDIFTNSRSYCPDECSTAGMRIDWNGIPEKEQESEPADKKRKVEVASLCITTDPLIVGSTRAIPVSDIIIPSSSLIGCYKQFSMDKQGSTEDANDEDLKNAQAEAAASSGEGNEQSAGTSETALPLPLSCRAKSKRKLGQLLKENRLEDLAIVTFKELFKRRYPAHGDLIEKLAADPSHSLFRVVTIVNKLTLHCLFTKTPKMTKEIFLSVATNNLSQIQKPVVLHTHSNPLYLLPEFCRPLGRAKHYMTGLMAPSIVWKIIGLIHADEARNEIARIIYGFSSKEKVNTSEEELSPQTDKDAIITTTNSPVTTHEDDTFASLDMNVLKMPSVKIMFEALTPRLAGEIVDSERLELLGDSLLKLVSSVEVFRHFPTKHEGFLTSQRAKTINNLFLMETCYRLRIHRFLRAFSLSNGKQQLKVRPPGMEGGKAKREKRALWNVNLWIQRTVGEDLVGSNRVGVKNDTSFPKPTTMSDGDDVDSAFDSDVPGIKLNLPSNSGGSGSNHLKTVSIDCTHKVPISDGSAFHAIDERSSNVANPMNSESLLVMEESNDEKNKPDKDSEDEATQSASEYFAKKYYPNPLHEIAFVKPKIIADMVEALIGAFYVAGGEAGGIAAVRALGAWPQIEQLEQESGSQNSTDAKVEQGLSSKLARNRISLEFIDQQEDFVFPPDYPAPLKRVALGACKKVEVEKEEGEEIEDVHEQLEKLKVPESSIVAPSELNNNEAIELLHEYARGLEPYKPTPFVNKSLGFDNGKHSSPVAAQRRFGINRPPEEVIPAIEQMLGYRFKNWKILEEALTHCSRPDRSSNQRLEFLGDAVLDFAVVSLLFELLPWAQPGELATFKTAATNNRNLGLVGAKLQIYRYLRFSSSKLEAEIEELDEVIEKWLSKHEPSPSCVSSTVDKVAQPTEQVTDATNIDPSFNTSLGKSVHQAEAESVPSEGNSSSGPLALGEMKGPPATTIPKLLASLETSSVTNSTTAGCSIDNPVKRKRKSKWDDPNPSPIPSHVVAPQYQESPLPVTQKPAPIIEPMPSMLSPPIKLDVEEIVSRAENLDDVIMDSLAKQSGTANQNGGTGSKEKKLTSRMINSASKSIADLFEALIGAVYLDCRCSMDEIRKIVLYINLVPQLNELHEAKLKGLNFALGDRGYLR